MGELLEGLDQWVQEVTGLSSAAQERVLSTVVTLVALWAVRVLILRIVARRGEKSTSSSTDKTKFYYHWRKGTAYAVYVFAFLLVGRIWIESFSSLATVVGLVSAGIAVALKDPLMNLAGWLFIVWRKPFGLGDRVQIGEYRGDVVDQGVLTFSLMEIGNWVNADDRTGRLLMAPNGLVFTQVLANYSSGWFEQIWNELELIVTFESDWRAAKELMTQIAAVHGRPPSETSQEHLRGGDRYYVLLAASIEPRVFVSLDNVGVKLTLRYLCMPFERRLSAEKIWEDILDAFYEHDDIDFAYPTVRYYDNASEGKSGARASDLPSA
ncbi:mechanosensitive ion channel family protein [Enhygromyxa salina]|uniref:mechanosensitive ion channel family protein n=1 Tax=Enhygromyxa salina TaxID=215803 RepID=UPI0015E5EC14|nr:mechanosensitive ion channel family protein [Enhygromyxa salina]